MIWLPLVISFISKGHFPWLGILKSDIKPKKERIARRHGYYRYTEIVEWDVAVIMTIGIITNLLLAIIGFSLRSYFPVFETFARLNIYYAIWLIIPIGSLDSTKLFFNSRGLWMTMAAITTLIFILTTTIL